MKRFWPWPDPRLHRRAATLLFACWLLLWWLTYATWIYDPSGRPLGMHPVAISAHLLVPVLAGALSWWWRQGSVRFAPARLLVSLAGAVAVFFLTTPLPSLLQFALSGAFLVGSFAVLGVHGFGRAALGGLLLLEVNLAALFVADALIAPSGGGGEGTGGGVLMALYEVLEWGTLLGCVGLLMGWVGGFLAWLLSGMLRRPPAASTGASSAANV